MSVPTFMKAAQGKWKGTSKLNLPWLPAEKQVTSSESHLHIESDPQDKYATLHYSWAYEGKREEGTLILAGDAKENRFEIGWSDSWHQSTGVLHLTGTSTDSSVKCRGSYTAEGETWGWTIELSTRGEEFHLKMENVMPGDNAVWAVLAVYTRE